MKSTDPDSVAQWRQGAFFKIVNGFAYPPPTLVQVLILAGPVNDRRWFPQPDAEISRYGWTAKCRSVMRRHQRLDGALISVR